MKNAVVTTTVRVIVLTLLGSAADAATLCVHCGATNGLSA